MSGYPSVSIAILIWHRHCNRKFSNSLSFCLQSHHEHGNTSLCIHLRQSYSLVKANSFCKFDIHRSVHRGWFSRNTNKMQFCNRIYYSQVYWRLNMFRAAQRSSSGALNSICSLWFIYPCGDRPLSRLSGWESINFGIINSITRLHLAGYFYWFILQCTDPWILNL
jgi:hypothetical protein